MKRWMEWAGRLGCLPQRIRHRIGLCCEALRYGRTPAHSQFFFIVTCERNAGEDALRCLDSVYRQDYPSDGYRHLFIDDASSDDTVARVEAWLAAHPDHRVDFIANRARAGGTANTLEGFVAAPAESVVLELNGDDWLPDPHVLAFLNRVYADEKVWMTYNTLCYPNGQVPPWARPYSRSVVRANSYRACSGWFSSHLHTFRRRLFDHLKPETFIDPETGELWASADDQAIYLAMLELAGSHSRHLYRITYVYNFHEQSHAYRDGGGSEARARRIRQQQKCQPLEFL